MSVSVNDKMQQTQGSDPEVDPDPDVEELPQSRDSVVNNSRVSVDQDPDPEIEIEIEGAEEVEGDDVGDDSEVDQTEAEDQGEDVEPETRVHELESQDQSQRQRRPRATYQGKPVCKYLWHGKCLHIESCEENYSHPPDIIGFKAKFFEDNGFPDPQKQKSAPRKRVTLAAATTATTFRDSQNPRTSQFSRKEMCLDWLFAGDCEHRNVDCEALHPMKWQGKGCKHGNDCKFLNTENGCKFYHAGRSDPRNTTVRGPRGSYQGQGPRHGQGQGQGYGHSQQPVFSEQYIEQAASHVMKLLQQQQQQQQQPQQSVYVPGLGMPGLGLPGLGVQGLGGIPGLVPGLVPGFVPGTVPMQTMQTMQAMPMHQLAVPLSQDMSLGPGQQSVNIRLMPVKPPVNFLSPGSGSHGYKQSLGSKQSQSQPQPQGSKQSHGNRTRTQTR
jgi:hypothetical protein